MVVAMADEISGLDSSSIGPRIIANITLQVHKFCLTRKTATNRQVVSGISGEL